MAFFNERMDFVSDKIQDWTENRKTGQTQI